MNLLSPFRPSAWSRLFLVYAKPWYPRLAKPIYAAKYVADGVISRFDMSVLGPSPKRSDYRFYVTQTLAAHAAKLDGIFISLGVAQGEHAQKILEKVKIKQPYWLVDSFDGRRTAADPTFKDGYVTDIEVVREKFKRYPNVYLLQGLVPDILAKLPGGPIVWTHFNLTDPDSEIPAIISMAPRLARGGFFIIDNFGRRSTSDAQRQGYLAAAKKVGLTALVLATGQALVFA